MTRQLLIAGLVGSFLVAATCLSDDVGNDIQDGCVYALIALVVAIVCLIGLIL